MLRTLGFERMIVTQVSAYGLDHTRLLAAVRALGSQRARGVAIIDKDISEASLKELHAGGIRIPPSTASSPRSSACLPIVIRRQSANP